MTRHLIGLLLVSAVVLCAAAFVFGVEVKACEQMLASYYGAESGSVTANGEKFTGNALTAAHRTLPFGTKLRVTYRGKSVVVRINDRGPFVKGRGLDLSRAAFAKLAPTGKGVIPVCVERL